MVRPYFKLTGLLALSLTLGFRTPSYNNLYLSGFFGTTTDSDANCSDADGFFDESICMPRMGIMLRYEFH